MPGYGTAEMSWEVIPTPGQPCVILNGTVQHVYSQLLEINSNHKTEDPKYLKAKRDESLANPNAATAASAPTAASPAIWGINCGGYHPASMKRIKDGISYLNNVTGRPINGPGPNNCGRVSCSYNSSIWWCNDASVPPPAYQFSFHADCGLQNATPEALPGFYSIATGAMRIVGACPGKNNRTISGTATHPDNWRVVVKGDRC